MAQVTLEKISKRFDKTQVIEDISLTIHDHEFVVLVGPSGCGKSTVLRMIAGLETPTDGIVKIGNHTVADTSPSNPLFVSPKDRDIAMVFQNYALYPHMSVYENMAFGLKMRKTPKADIDSKVKTAAKMLDLEKVLDRKPKQLSGGQRQRVALGRAIVRNPQVFLMDEPLSNLDAKLRVTMRSEIAQLHKRLNATTVYVTHDQVEAMTMGDRIVILNQGKIQQVDTPMAVYQKPANLFVAGFIGQMNFIQGTLTSPTELSVTDGSTLTLKQPLPAQVGQLITLGIRPEAFDISENSSQATSQTALKLTVTIDRLEQLGSEQWAYFHFAGQTMHAKLDSDLTLKTGQPITLSVSPEQIHCFDTANQKRL